ncbi:hypothetical protein [Actinoplanes xinjiangensis]|uniref:Uncharacterized protein n=1 Tax=Actinoplanes xinjiangensis TaxID=512350 RepID=A0A316F579_9ACTN|nr:hypothetical protein [Actinoplanes xinjiangensis]PWK41192.1 hypothetical protein BC793_11759 [Actinoplanes xinjiangensis]GIF42124.1 hypothetical protein Axi01nite_64350 [Actinoplanes xinjiangensis]
MSHDLDERIVATLQAHAGGDLDTEALVGRARANGGRLKRRRRAVAVLGTAAVSAVVAVTTLFGPSLPAPGPATVALPAAPDRPGATARPELVGTDATTLHFSAADLTAGARYVTWAAGGGTESVEVRGDTMTALFVLARTEEDLAGEQRTLGASGDPVTTYDVRVGDRPGTVWVDDLPGGAGLWTVRWQPADGLWAKLESFAHDPEQAVAATAKVRLDSAQRCATPFRLTDVPGGMRILHCSVTLGGRGFEEGALRVGDDEHWFSLRVERSHPDNPLADTSHGDLTAGPYQVERRSDGVLTTVVGSCSVGLIREGWGDWGDGVTEAEAIRLLAGYRQADNLDDAGSW